VTHKITAVTAGAQFGQIMDRAIEHNERFLVDRDGEPVVIIMSVQDFVRTLAPPPDWLRQAWDHAQRQGVDQLTMDDINAEIAAARRDRRHHRNQPNP